MTERPISADDERANGTTVSSDDDAHLVSACAAIERVLARRHPEHTWIVEVARDD